MIKKGTKEFDEILAKLILTNCVDKKNDKLKVIKKERPDIQSEELNVGIEVTRAIPSIEGQANSISAHNFGKNKKYNEIIENTEKYYKTFNGEINNCNGATTLSATKGLITIKSRIDCLIKSIKEKTSNLNEKYKVFDENHLFVYSDEIIDDFDIIEVLKNVPLYVNNYRIKYNKIYVYCYMNEPELIIWDNGKIKTIIINNISELINETKNYSGDKE